MKTVGRLPRSGRSGRLFKETLGIAAAAGLVLVLLQGAQAATIQIGPGADLVGATGADTANEARLNVARTDTVTLAAGTYSVLDFRFNVLNPNTGTGNAGTVAPMLVTGSPSSYTTLWVGSAFDPTSSGAQTAATYAPGAQTFTLTSPGTVYGGIFTGNNGSGVPAYANSVGLTDHDNSYTAPTAEGESVSGFSNANLGRAYAFEINIDVGLGDVVPSVSTSNANSSAASTDLLQTSLASVINVGVGGPAGGDGPDGDEAVLRDGTATNTSGYANGSLTAARISNGDVLTYIFDTTVNRSGYLIDGVDLFHGWKDGGRDRVSSFDLAYATVSAPGTFISLLSGGDSGNYNNSYGRTTGSFLATEVAALRITFNSIENGYGGISEIDVLGRAVVPEPATISLLGLTITGLGGYIRRRR